MSLKRYDIIERVGPNDAKHRIIMLDEDEFDNYTDPGVITQNSIEDIAAELVGDGYFIQPQTNKEKLMLFHRKYESQWDYLHRTFECGLMWLFFIHDEAPDFKWMYNSPKPTHISKVPEAIRERYISYLHKEYAKQISNHPNEVIYTELDAAEEYCENL